MLVNSSNSSTPEGNRRVRTAHPTRGGTDDLDELPDDSRIYWRVKAMDFQGHEVWSNQGTDGWWFYVQVPEPPPPFELAEPPHHTTLDYEAITPVTLGWEDASDPDPGDTTRYDVYLICTFDDTVDTLSYFQQPDATLDVNIPDSVGVEYWDDMSSVLWWVLATSDGDTTRCEQDFAILLEPHVGVPENPFAGLPEAYSIAALYPNPFNPTTTVVIGLPEAAPLKVEVFNILGERVETVVNSDLSAGYHSLRLEASQWASGLYFIRAQSPGNLNQVRKMMLVR